MADPTNRQGQYASSPRNGTLHRTRDFFPSSAGDHRLYSLRLPTDGWTNSDEGDTLLVVVQVHDIFHGISFS